MSRFERFRTHSNPPRRSASQVRPLPHPPHNVHIRVMAELIIRRGLDEPDTSGNFVPHKPAPPGKSAAGRPFRIVSEYEPAGDQR